MQTVRTSKFCNIWHFWPFKYNGGFISGASVLQGGDFVKLSYKTNLLSNGI